jgi:hypothetical protein
MLITDLIAEVWSLLPEGLWWVLGGLGAIVFFVLRAEAR